MAKKLFAIVLGFMLAPAFIVAEDTAGGSIVGTVCLVRVYTTNFNFPPQGGRIVQIGNEMFFWRNYLPECANTLPANQSVVVSSSTGRQNPAASLTGSNGNQIVGEPCAVRVYHTNFVFPPEGGKIVKLGNEMFFIRDYKPGCENAGSSGQVLATSTNRYNPLQTGLTTTASSTALTYVDPSLTSSASTTQASTTTPTTCK